MKREMIVTVNLHKDRHGFWWADSDDLFGLHVWERTKRELEAAVPCAITELMAANGFDVSEVKERAVIPKAIRAESPPRRTAYVLESAPA